MNGQSPVEAATSALRSLCYDACRWLHSEREDHFVPSLDSAAELESIRPSPFRSDCNVCSFLYVTQPSSTLCSSRMLFVGTTLSPKHNHHCPFLRQSEVEIYFLLWPFLVRRIEIQAETWSTQAYQSSYDLYLHHCFDTFSALIFSKGREALEHLTLC